MYSLRVCIRVCKISDACQASYIFPLTRPRSCRSPRTHQRDRPQFYPPATAVNRFAGIARGFLVF